MSELSFKRDIPIRHEVDVFVAGGGPAGAAAAVTAARQGRKVFLAEGHSCLGGMGTAGLVPAFMHFGDGESFLASGFGEDLLDRLLAVGGTDAPADISTRGGKSCCYAIRPEALKRVYDDMLADAGVDFTLHTNLVAVEADGGKVNAVICWGKSGLFAVKAKMYVDGTGDGDLAAWAGAPFEKGNEEGLMMPPTLVSLWAGIDFDAFKNSGVHHWHQNARIEEAYKAGVFTHCDKHLPGMWELGNGLVGGNLGHLFGTDSTDERSLTKALVRGRKLVLEYERYYKEYLKGFEKMTLAATGSLLGVRESRRIMGDYVLCLDDFKKRAVFADEIGRYCYAVDIHVMKPDSEKEYKRFEEEFAAMRYGRGESYGIPYRTLTPRGLSNVLVAGRCISTDRFLEGSIRVMPGCYITGQAAGMAASLAIEHNTDTRRVAVPELQARLIKMGAHLPNAGK